MEDDALPSFVVLPCSAERSWVVPQSCLGEVVTIPTSSEQPPESICWREEVIPVVDFDQQGLCPWRDRLTGAGLIAVVLGQRDESCQYFAVALRGGAPGVSQLVEDDIEDLPDSELEFTAAAFRMNGNVYQVPDLLALQQALSAGKRAIN